MPPAIWKMFSSYSQDRGRTFAANVDLGTPVFPGQQGDLFSTTAVGEFNGLTSRNGSVYATWTDTHTGDSAVYLAIGKCQ